MSDKRDKLSPSETDGDLEKSSSGDVEAHKMSNRMGEAERMGEPEDKIAATDDDADVEGHMLGHKHSSGKMQS